VKRWVRGLIVSILVAGVMAHPDVMAQSGSASDAYVSELTGWSIEVTGPNYAIQSAALEEYPHGRGERIAVHAVGLPAYAEIAYFDDADAPEETIAITLREFEATSQNVRILESGKSGDTHYSLAAFQLNASVSGYFYMEVVPDVSGNVDAAQSLFTFNLDFPEQLLLAGSEISVNGDPFLGEAAIDVGEVIAADLDANAVATPIRTSFAYETVDAVVDVNPPVSLDFDSNANGFESINVSMESTFGIIGFLQQEATDPADILTGILSSAPVGEEAPVQVHVEEDRERITAVYRIHREGSVTVMIVQVTAVGAGLWRVEALAGPEERISTDLSVFQRSITIDGDRFLDSTSGEMLTDILGDSQP
jgi:hypothetical protein